MRTILGKGYYAFIHVGDWLGFRGWTDSEPLGQYLAEEHGVAIVPGAYFSPYGRDWIRFSYATPVERTLARQSDFSMVWMLYEASMRYNPELFAEKYRLAVAAAAESKPQGGLCGIELEWNLLDSQFRPLLTVGSGPFQQSFVDYLRAECLSPWLREYSQLEVFHWMIEWATRPYYHPRGASTKRG